MYGFGKTDTGRLRSINQDFIYINNYPIGSLDNLYIVADGIGGHNAGEIASKKAVEFFVDHIRENAKTDEVLDIFADAATYANKKVFELGNTLEEYQNMGTTLLAVTKKNDKLFIVHIGDSRLYGVRNKKILQITTDHTYAMELFKAGGVALEETENMPQKHMLTRAVGTEKNVEVDALFLDVLKDDVFILCSDGLSNMLDEKEILKILDENVDTDLSSIENAVNKLIETANNNGGKDNIAVIILK